MKESNLMDITDNLFKLLIYLNRNILNPDLIMKSFPMPPSHFKVMFFLHHNGSETVSNIGKRLGISKPNMTPIIDKLIAEGYVKRSPDLKDRRKIILSLTDKANEFLCEQKQTVINMVQERLSHLSEDDLKTVEVSTENLLKILSSLYPEQTVKCDKH